MKTKYLLAIALAPAAMLGACSGNGSSELSQEETAITFETYSVDAIASMGDSTQTENLVRVTAEGVLPANMSGEEPSELRDSLERMAGVKFDAAGTAQARLNDDMKPTRLSPTDTQACSLMASTLTVTLLTPRVIVWKSSSFTYACGAAHGLGTSRYLNYDRLTKKIIKLSDVFAPGYEDPLRALLRDKLKNTPDLLVPLDSIDIPAEFCVLADGMQFNYGVYSIAPYSSGEIVVPLTATEISVLLSPKGEELIFGQKSE